MKKIFICLLCVGLLFGCSGKKSSPTNTVKSYLDETKTKVETGTQDLINQYLGEEKFTPPADMIKKLGDFTYKITNETITDQNATVVVNCTTYNFGEAFKVVFPTVFTYVFSESISGTDEATMQQEVERMMIEGLNKAEKNYTVDITLNLHLDENKQWVLDNANELENMLSGNLKDTVNELSSAFTTGQ